MNELPASKWQPKRWHNQLLVCSGLVALAGLAVVAFGNRDTKLLFGAVFMTLTFMLALAAFLKSFDKS